MGTPLHRRPARILAVLLGIVVVFVAASVFFGGLMVRTFNDDALAGSRRQVGHAVADLVERVDALTLDYAKWDEAARGVAAGDMPWLYANIGSSAAWGEAMQLAVVWGGPFAQDRGWTDDGVEAARPGLVDPQDLVRAQAALAAVPPGSYEGTTFFLRRGNEVFAVGAARIESLEEGAEPPAGGDRAPAANLLLGLRVDQEALHDIGDAFRLSGVRVVAQPTPGDPSVPLRGRDGHAVAHIAWDAPRPAAALLADMLAGGIAVAVLALGLSGVGVALVRRNVRDLMDAERHASVAARTDMLTGLPNRTAFNDALAGPARAGERAVLFLDVNGFKRINDSVGHAAGDRVVVELARRLARLAGPGRVLARIAGDEFVFVVAHPDAGDRARRLAAEVGDALREPFEVLGHRMRVHVAMGYAVQAGDGMDGDDLVRQADLAMYEAKRRKDGAPVAFSAVIEQASRDAVVLEDGLRAALGRPGELSVVYQPIVGMDGRLVRAEALARWTSPELGPVPPDRFIAVAERAGLIVDLGRRLFARVCDDLAAHPGLAVSVNVSPLQIMAPDFVPSVVSEIEARGIDPGRIEVELTETVVVHDAGLAAERLAQLRAAGFSTALDDFGTGFSSIGTLRQMGFDTLKIDRSFVSGVMASPDLRALTTSMIDMAHALRLSVVCEGVETPEELDLLRDLGCDLAQGYHLDRPLPVGALAARWFAPPPEAAAVA